MEAILAFNPTETTHNLTNTIKSVVHKTLDKVMGDSKKVLTDNKSTSFCFTLLLKSIKQTENNERTKVLKGGWGEELNIIKQSKIVTHENLGFDFCFQCFFIMVNLLMILKYIERNCEATLQLQISVSFPVVFCFSETWHGSDLSVLTVPGFHLFVLHFYHISHIRGGHLFLAPVCSWLTCCYLNILLFVMKLRNHHLPWISHVVLLLVHLVRWQWWACIGLLLLNFLLDCMTLDSFCPNCLLLLNMLF